MGYRKGSNEEFFYTERTVEKQKNETVKQNIKMLQTQLSILINQETEQKIK